MYKVIKNFKDLQDNGYAYHAGDTYPRNGLKVDQKRINSLLSAENRRGEALIRGIPSGGVSEVKEEPLEDNTDVDSPKRTKAKRSTRKTQE